MTTRTRPLFTLLLIFLVISIGISWVFYLYTLSEEELRATEETEIVAIANEVDQVGSSISKEPLRISNSVINESWANTVAAEINSLLINNRWENAVSKINEVYSQASLDELEQFKALVLQYTDTLIKQGSKQSASDLLEQYANAFDDIDAWRRLGEVASSLGKWDLAVEALIAYSAQEYRPQEFEESLEDLVRVAANARTALEQRNDIAGILALYQRLYEQHPQYSRFQLELAQSHLRLSDPQSATPILETLQYDSELGPLAAQLLEKIQSDFAVEEPINESRNDQFNDPNDILVPLQRSGSSLLVDVAINRESMRLLLDTGASITALSANTIRSLRLEPIGRSITLSTANGKVSSELYRANSIRLGRLRLNNLIVAEIDFGSNSAVAGLLGTDVLNELNSDFNYVIDNEKNALIFRKK